MDWSKWLEPAALIGLVSGTAATIGAYNAWKGRRMLQRDARPIVTVKIEPDDGERANLYRVYIGLQNPTDENWLFERLTVRRPRGAWVANALDDHDRCFVFTADRIAALTDVVEVGAQVRSAGKRQLLFDRQYHLDKTHRHFVLSVPPSRWTTSIKVVLRLTVSSMEVNQRRCEIDIVRTLKTHTAQVAAQSSNEKS